MKEILKNAEIRKQHSDKGLDMIKLVLDKNVPDEEVVNRAVQYIRQRFVKTTMDSLRNDDSLDIELIRNEKGNGISGVPVSILLLRKRSEPLIEYQKLTKHSLDWAVIRDLINTIARYDDSTVKKDDWKEIWYASEFLEYHLERILRRDRQQMIKEQFLIEGKTPRVERFRSPVKTDGINWVFADILGMKEHYGNRERFQEFVYNYPLYSFSRLQAASLSDQFSDDEIVRLFVNYGKKLIDSPERRKKFYREVTDRVRDGVKHEFMQRAGITDEER